MVSVLTPINKLDQWSKYPSLLATNMQGFCNLKSNRLWYNDISEEKIGGRSPLWFCFMLGTVLSPLFKCYLTNSFNLQDLSNMTLVNDCHRGDKKLKVHYGQWISLMCPANCFNHKFNFQTYWCDHYYSGVLLKWELPSLPPLSLEKEEY